MRLIFAYRPIQFHSVTTFSLLLHNNFRSDNILIRQTSEQKTSKPKKKSILFLMLEKNWTEKHFPNVFLL